MCLGLNVVLKISTRESVRCLQFDPLLQGEVPSLFYLVLHHRNNLPLVRKSPHPNHYAGAGQPVVVFPLNDGSQTRKLQLSLSKSKA